MKSRVLRNTLYGGKGRSFVCRPEVPFGPKYKSVIVYSPDGENRDLICFEPMAGITDAMNLAHRGIYEECRMALRTTKGNEKLECTAPSQSRFGSFATVTEPRPRESGDFLKVLMSFSRELQ